MKKAVMVLGVFLLTGQLLWAGDKKTIAVVKMKRLNVYEHVYKGFEEEMRRDVITVVLEDGDPVQILRRIREIRPDLILAIGGMSYETVLGIDGIPIVYVSPTVPQDLPLGKTNLTGVTMIVSPEKQLELISAAFPHVKTVGLFFSAKWTRDLAKKTASAGLKRGLTVITEQIRTEADYVAALEKYRKTFDAFLMLPDTVVLTTSTVKALMRFSYRNDVPVFTFAKKFMNKGAVMSVGVVPRDVGRQAWEITDNILRGNAPDREAHEFAEKPHVMVNREAARLLEARFSADAIRVDIFF